MRVEKSAGSKVRSVSIARAVVHRVDGSTEVHYSVEKVPWWDLVRQYKLIKHLYFMQEEDRKAGYVSN